MSKQNSETIEDLAEDDVPPWAAGTRGREHELYPTLNDEEIALLCGYGEQKSYEKGSYVWSAGDKSAFYLILEGAVDVIRSVGDEYHVIVTHTVGQYVGEITSMTGASALVSGVATEPVKALVIDSDNIRRMIATEAELGEKVLLSFILRRMRMIANRLGNVTLIGPNGDADTAGLQRFLSRNGIPFDVLNPQAEQAAVESRLANVSEHSEQWPQVVCDNESLVRPSLRQVAEHLGFTARLENGAKYDVAIIGSGPAGMAASVYAASEGMSVVVLENCAPGGQAGSSSRIENYMGFPTGISGQALMGRGYLQAQKFGAQIAIARELQALECNDPMHELKLDGGDTIHARAVVIATGAIYRQPDIDGLSESGGVHYGASHVEGELCRGQNVAIVGGGNSAGQAAVYLAKRANSVRILVRGDGLGHSMSDYLIQRIERLPNVELMTHTEVTGIHGEDGMESIAIVNNQSGETDILNVSQLFIFIGAQPGTSFVKAPLILDKKGFVPTGDALSEDDLKASGWSLQRRPFPLETSCPRVFACGDVRSGSVKRVASAVGEGSVCVQYIHSAFSEQDQ